MYVIIYVLRNKSKSTTPPPPNKLPVVAENEGVQVGQVGEGVRIKKFYLVVAQIPQKKKH